MTKPSPAKVIADAPPTPAAEAERKWTILVVEDDDETRRDIVEELNHLEIDGYRCHVIETDLISKESTQLAAQTADLTILDLSDEGTGEKDAGMAIVASLSKNSWGPCIIYSAHADVYKTGVESHTVRFLTKGGTNGSVQNLSALVSEVFQNGLPQAKHAIRSAMNTAISEVLWNEPDQDFNRLFAEGERAAGLRTICRRVAGALGSGETLQRMSTLVGEDWSEDTGVIAPEEMYVRPPLVGHLTTGALLRDPDGKVVVVLSPACDLVPGQGKKGAHGCKIENVLVAPAIEWPLPAGEIKVKELGKTKAIGQAKEHALKVKNQNPAEGNFYLPAAFGEPHRVIDFKQVYTIPVDEAAEFDHFQTLESPFAQAMVQAFAVDISRIGLPQMPTANAIAAWQAAVEAEHAAQTVGEK